MSSTINTNLASMIAQAGVNRSQSELAKTIARLSSGLRINSARDDAAGLAISDRFGAQIRGLDQSARNTNDGISLAQTADGGLASAGGLLQRIRELAVQAANGASSASDRASLQLEVAQLAQEADRIATGTSFNGKKLLDGSLTAQRLQVGANIGQTVDFGIASARLADLVTTTVITGGAGSYDLTTTTDPSENGQTGGGYLGNNIQAQTLTIAGSAGSAPISIATNDYASWIVDAVNAQTGSTGVSATATNTLELRFSTPPGHIHFLLQGDNTPHVATMNNAVMIDADAPTADYNGLVGAIMGAYPIIGVTAVATPTGVILTSHNGDDLQFAVFSTTNGFGADAIDSAGNTLVTLGTGGYTALTRHGDITFHSADPFTVSNAVSGAHLFSTTGSHAAVGSGGGPPVTTTYTPSIDVSTVAGANAAITSMDLALARLGSNRAGVGALQNRLASVLGNVQTTSQNLQVARGHIVDADFASEVAAMTRAQLVLDAGLSMVAQANAAPSNIMTLLRSVQGG